MGSKSSKLKVTPVTHFGKSINELQKIGAIKNTSARYERAHAVFLSVRSHAEKQLVSRLPLSKLAPRLQRRNFIAMQPVNESDRIESLDVLRGFSLLGILLLNIMGFGFIAAAYTTPGLIVTSTADLVTWAGVELFAEGAMRALFSILFGAGVLLFLGKDSHSRGWLHFKRTTWLLIFGLANGYILLWTGDILVTYALAGFLLYFMRNLTGQTLLKLSITALVLISLYNTAMHFGLKYLRDSAQAVAALEAQGSDVPKSLKESAEEWIAFKSEVSPAPDVIVEETEQRSTSYRSAFLWTLDHNTEILSSTLWQILLPDALVLMILGMALFRLGILQGNAADHIYWKMMIYGFSTGLVINSFEVWYAIQSQLAVIEAFTILSPTYHLGRVAMALGWVGALILMIKRGGIGWRLGNVGRMALTNYLMQSLICLFIFTGAGLGLVNQIALPQTYLLVLMIWVFQLMFSTWWLQRFYYGPMEWLWRALTYGRRPIFLRTVR